MWRSIRIRGLGEVAERVEILDLDLGADSWRRAAHADIGVTAERTFSMLQSLTPCRGGFDVAW